MMLILQSMYITSLPIQFKDHEVTVSKQTTNVRRIYKTSRGVTKKTSLKKNKRKGTLLNILQPVQWLRLLLSIQMRSLNMMLNMTEFLQKIKRN